MRTLKQMLRMSKKNNTTKSFSSCGGVPISCSSGNFFGYQQGSYDNTFPNVARISEAFAEVLPYAVDINGDKLEQQPQLIKALFNPNRQMSGVKFFETLAVMTLVHPTAYILCWHQQDGGAVSGGPITPENIAGFTFLENPSVQIVEGHKIYRCKEQVYGEDSVIEISLNVNPYSLLDGYSPSMAAKKWSNVDDYIVDFQAGFFRNGAVPAGQFIITAPTIEEYDQIVDSLQRQHRGAGANNNVVYVHRPINSMTGETMSAQIEWVPFAQSNKDLTLQALFDQSNKKIDMDFGVPQEVKGYLQNSNYASVEVADYIFSRRVVYPKLVKIWSEFTHEMNRITGGLGFAISFDYEPPVLTETRQTQLATLLSATNNGYTLESAVKALQLPRSFLELATSNETAPEQERQDVETIPSEADQQQTSTKSLKKKTPEQERKLYDAVRDQMQEQIDKAKDGKDYSGEGNKTAIKVAIFLLIMMMVDDSGKKQYEVGAKQIDANPEDLTTYETTDELKTAYEEYLDEVSVSFTADTARAIDTVIQQADFEGWNSDKTKAELQNLMDTQKWRIERITRTEAHRAELYGKLEAMKQLSRETGKEIVKTWHVNPASLNPCEDCIELDGYTIPLDESFGTFEFGSGNVADRHPNCLCYLTFEVVEKPKMVKITCPECGRYMFESENSNVKGVICQNSHCKKRWDFEIKNGKVNAKEVK